MTKEEAVLENEKAISLLRMELGMMKQPRASNHEISTHVTHSRQIRLEQRLLSLTAAAATLLLLLALSGLSLYNSDYYKNPYYPADDSAQLTSYSTPVYQFFVPPGWRIVELEGPLVARKIGSLEFISIHVETSPENLLAPQLFNEQTVKALALRGVTEQLGDGRNIQINRMFKSTLQDLPVLRFDFEVGSFKGRGLCLLCRDARLVWIGCWESPTAGFIRKGDAHLAAVGHRYIRLKHPYDQPVYERPFIRRPSVSPNLFDIWPRMETTITELETNDSLPPTEQDRLQSLLAKDLAVISASGKRPAWAIDFHQRLANLAVE